MFISWWIIKERLLIVVEENLESKNDTPPRKLLEEIRDQFKYRCFNWRRGTIIYSNSSKRLSTPREGKLS